MKIALTLGTRPEIIKMSPIIRELDGRNSEYFIIHSGQHYDYMMDGAFFNELNLPAPKYNLKVGSGSHAKQTALIMTKIERLLIKEKPDLTLVQGDTNTAISGALVTAKLNKSLGHVEAGLRSFDKRMPEEVNRIIVDHLSNILFAPTQISKNNLKKEGIEESRIFVTGNTIVDSVKQNLILSKSKSDVLTKLGLDEQDFFILTLHRAENVDNKKELEDILESLLLIREEYSSKIVFPLHPRTKKMIIDYGISLKGFNTIDPIGYLDFLQLESSARMIFTDSGGVQEEACILKVPCITLRDNTERPETVQVGANMVVRNPKADLSRSVREMRQRGKSWLNPFGAGDSAKKIVDIIQKLED